MMKLSDQPIKHTQDDVLGRDHFAQHLARAIQNHKHPDCFVVGLHGPWGSGKSSILNLCKQHLSDDADNSPTIVEFNPWTYSKKTDITKEFFLQVGKTLGQKDASADDKKRAELFEKLAMVFALAPSIDELKIGLTALAGLFIFLGVSIGQIIGTWFTPIMCSLSAVTLFLTFIGKRVPILRDFYTRGAEKNKQSLEEMKLEQWKRMATREKKLLIIIDDIDRLTPDEMADIFRVIRINADFPNTLYLLSFDREVVEDALSNELKISGSKYLEKIVQVPFPVPVCSRYLLEKYLYEQLDVVYADLPQETQQYIINNTDYFNAIFYGGLKDLFVDIREVKRFINALGFTIANLNNNDVLEVNPIDLFTIEAIRVLAPQYFAFIYSNKYLLTSWEAHIVPPNVKADFEKKQLELLDAGLEKAHSSIREHLRELTCHLFPLIGGVVCKSRKSKFGSSNYANVHRRICSEDYFNRYFSLTPVFENGDISEYELERAFSATVDEQTFERVLQEYFNKGKIKRLVERLKNYINASNKIPPGHYGNVIKALWNIVDNIPRDDVGYYDYSSVTTIHHIVSDLLEQEYGNPQTNYELISNLIPASKGLVGPFWLVNYEIKMGDRRDKIAIFEEDDLENLKQLCLDLLGENMERFGALDGAKYTLILDCWKEWGQRTAWSEYIQRATEADDFFIKFVGRFIHTAKSIGGGKPGVTREDIFNFESLSQHINLIETRQRLLDIKESNTEFYSENQRVIDLFLDTVPLEENAVA